MKCGDIEMPMNTYENKIVNVYFSIPDSFYRIGLN